MKMRVISRVVDKKLQDNNNLLQTLHKKDTRIRKAFVPADGYDMYLMDLDQVEYRLFAHYAKSTGLIEAIKNGKDVHTATAELIYGTTDVTPEQRSNAKTLNFSLLYGSGDAATASSLGLTVSEARDFKNRYFSQIPEAQPFIETVKAVTRQRGYIKNFYGRRRRLTHNETYKATNALIQGCAADYLKLKIVDIYKYLKYNKCKTRMINVVHDEIIFEIHKSERHLVPILKTLLSDFTSFRVPLTAGAELGDPSWGDKKDAEAPFVDNIDASYKQYNIHRGAAFE
jgi:DNA polymerase-1